ncbi:MAG TPA: FAD-dependent oxidoreductase, partial [Candidatus Eisenbacteria bacterium]|nr:FAD-dependent oxidoreductase [Candidatus Eisenbacteria bacterium]
MTGESIRIGPDGRLVSDKTAALPEVLDILIAGAGPAGTSVAFRARELSLSALVLDADDILKRIRDYAKEKPILPDYGPGDKMKFPRAGELINLLHFDAIDKDEMHAAWKQYYVRHNIPVQVGTELTDLEREKDLWLAKVWNHNLKSGQSFRARHVVLALGRGVPRRFDIPGDTDGIAFRLNDAASYIGIGPVCVVGGGTSAAEAVIAVSNAKVKAGDACEVYWSYRGTKLPRVSRALAEPFFEAYVVNGNVRYLPLSDPAAVVTGADKKGYLSVRIDRRTLENRPGETVHLEFPKESCIACIGEDIPEDFLSGMGIRMRSQEPGGKKRLVVSSILESEQPNVYVIGDTLSDFYLQTSDFLADASTFERIRRPGNVKAALRDGVFVTEVIKQRLDGRATIEVKVEFDEPQLEKTDKAVTTIVRGVDPQGPPPESKKDVSEDIAGYVIRLLPSGTEEQRYPIANGKVVSVGRKNATISIDT